MLFLVVDEASIARLVELQTTGLCDSAPRRYILFWVGPWYSPTAGIHLSIVGWCVWGDFKYQQGVDCSLLQTLYFHERQEHAIFSTLHNL